MKDIESAVEGILFAAGEPVEAQRLCAVLELDRETVDAVVRALADRYAYERRGMRILTLEDRYQMCSAPEHAEIIRRALETRKPPQLSQPALEALAVIAYFQPATRAFVEQIRGVDSAYTVKLLAERGLIEEAGRLAAPGRPVLFRTTTLFLRCFGLSSLEDLPPLPDSGEDGQLSLELEQAVAQLRREQESAEA
ncbi:MAG: SMC-Scp complex subunit ScpB [Candidatus Onthomonas sp.]|nr:SMC-Scp complex subunit ScpB [Candidatus Onthomonas sp.]